MTGQSRSPLLLRPALRRFWLIPLVLAAMGGAVGDDMELRSMPLYRASAVYVVTTGSVDTPSVLAVDANSVRLSRTYALVLRQDQQLLDGVASQLGDTADSVRASLDSRFVPGSASIIVTYAARDAAKVDRFFEVFTRAVATEQPATDNIEGGLIRPLRLPQSVQRVPGGIEVDWRLGALAGLLAGLGVALVAERAAPRVHDVDHLQLLRAEGVVGRVEVRHGDVQDLLRVVSGRAPTQAVAVVALPPAPCSAADAVAARCRCRAQELVADGELSERFAMTNWRPFNHHDTARLAQSTASTTPVVVLVRQGQLVRRIDRELERLTDVLPDRSVVLALVDEQLPQRDGRELRHRHLVGHR